MSIGTRNLAATGKGSDSSSHGTFCRGNAGSSLKIAIINESPVRAAILENGLREAGFTQVERITEMHNLLSRIYALGPT